MYVLCCPCVLSPSLRAKGITKSSDLELFRKTIERCKKFNIEIVPLPCPETLFLGPDRKPGTFLERLDLAEFFVFLDELTKKVNIIVENRGPPLCIIGVNSSPTCGVTSTYYGADGDKPPKREGRGVFLSGFPKIVAVDVGSFGRYCVYFAAPLFSNAERSYNASVAEILRNNLFEVYLPQECGDDSGTRDANHQEHLFLKNKQALDACDIVVAVIDGADADSGTAWEMGYAFAKGKPVIALRTDFRKAGNHEQVNLMLERSATAVVAGTEQLLEVMKSPFPRIGINN